MKEITINPFEVTKEINIGYQYDHNATKVLFDGLEEDNYYLKLQDRQTYQAFPIPEKSWTVTSTYTQQTLLTAQIYRKVDGELIAHTPKFRMSLKSSLPQSDTIKEVVPPNFQTAYDEIVETTNDIKTKFENGEFNGKDGYSPTVQVTPIDNGNKVSITDEQGTKSFEIKNGTDGKSAYQIAVDNGFEGTEQEWLDSLDYEHSDEFTNLANQVKQDAQTSNNAVDTVTQLKKDVENIVVEFDQTVETANTDFDNKVNQANSGFDTKVQSANTTIDEKVTEATNQAKKAKDEADRATLATDGKLDKNQGTDNVGKVMVVGEDGELTPTEFKSGSDNKLIGTVSKTSNPNITDGYPNNFMNLKLYGQSTQGADPSPTNKQDITAISQFDGAPTNINLLTNDPSKWTMNTGLSWGGTPNTEVNFVPSQKYKSFIKLSGIKSNTLYSFKNDNISGLWLDRIIELNSQNLGVVNHNLYRDVTTSNKDFYSFTTGANTTAVYIQVRTLPASGNVDSADITNEDIENMMISFGMGDLTEYNPYVSQPFTYTPTNPMYSTQDGSISDYVDVEKGVEVYNMKIRVFDGSPDEWWEAYKLYNHNGYDINIPDMTVGYRQKFWCSIYPVSEDKVWFGVNSTFMYLINVAIDTGASTLEEWRAWLAQNPITVIYQSSTPTEIPINPIQLAILRALMTYNGVTNFLCNAPVSFDYEQSLQIVINNIWNAIGQTNANILIGGNE